MYGSPDIYGAAIPASELASYSQAVESSKGFTQMLETFGSDDLGRRGQSGGPRISVSELAGYRQASGPSKGYSTVFGSDDYGKRTSGYLRSGYDTGRVR